jgi:hypothetical protein
MSVEEYLTRIEAALAQQGELLARISERQDAQDQALQDLQDDLDDLAGVGDTEKTI